MNPDEDGFSSFRGRDVEIHTVEYEFRSCVESLVDEVIGCAPASAESLSSWSR